MVAVFLTGSTECCIDSKLFWSHLCRVWTQGCGSSQIFNASASSSSSSFMLPSLLPLPHFWKFLLPVPGRASRFRVRFRFQSFSSKCFRFRFHKNLTASTSLLSMTQLIVFSFKKSRQVYFVSYFIWLVLSTGHGMEWKTIFLYSILAIFVHSISIPY